MEGSMNYRIVLLALSGLSVLNCAEKRKEPDFRETNWGISSDQVKMIETEKLVMDNGKMLSFEGTVGGLPCQIVYVFVKDQLVRGHYYFSIEHKNDNPYFSDYEKLKETLTAKYGSTRLDDAKWKNETYRGDSEKVGLAIRSGDLSLAAEWETPTSEIWLFLAGENSRIKLSMKYVSKLLANLKEEESDVKSAEPETHEF
jgi:hypothetical protein